MLPRAATAAAVLSSSESSITTTPTVLRRGFATVYAWGRGLEGQTGVEGAAPAATAVVPHPTPLIDLHGRDIARVSAGRLSSCAVTTSGEAYTWGDGRSGLLGHGSGRAALRVATPQRVEALFSRASVAGAALGDAHALFVSGDGAAFACGENKEGQLGLGTPLEVLAAQHRRALGVGGGGAGSGGAGPSRLIREAALAAIRGNGRPASSLAHAWPGTGGAGGAGSGFGLRRGGGGGGAAGANGNGNGPSPSSSPNPSSLREILYAGRPPNGHPSSSPFWPGGGHGGASAFAAPSPLHASWAGAGASAQRNGGNAAATGFGGGGLFAASEPAAASGGGVGSGWDSGLAPGQVGHPVRVGSDAHALWGDDEQEDEGGAADSPSSSLFSEQIVAASASRYCSALLTRRGEVWTFGSDFNGALGSAAGATWQPGPRRVGGALGQAIADGGGAVAVATGGGFAAALTREGGVLVWGRLAGEDEASSSSGVGGQQTRRGSRPSRGGGNNASSSRPPFSSSSPIPARPIPGAAMPAWALGGASTNSTTTNTTPHPHRFAAIAAGQRHLLLSDTEGRVWAVGSWLGARGRPAGAAPLVRPKLVLDLGCEGGVSRLAAGPHASAVVSGDGRLYLWGRLLDRSIADEAWRAAEAAAVAASAGRGGGGLGAEDDHAGAWAAAALQRQRRQTDFAWPGFGGDRPRLVPELTGVRDVALGGHHALAVVD